MELVFRDVQVSFRDYAVANLRYSWRMHRGRVLWLLGLPVAILSLFFMSRVYGPSNAAYAVPGWQNILVGVAVLALMGYSFWRGLRRRYNLTQFLHAPVTYTFTEAGISVSSPTVQATTTWATIDKLVPVGAEWMLLTTRNLTAYFLDLRCLEAPATEADFRALLARHQIPLR